MVWVGEGKGEKTLLKFFDELGKERSQALTHVTLDLGAAYEVGRINRRLYTTTGLSKGLREGLNNKIRLITRRDFGFHGAQALTARSHLCCGGLSLTPSRPAPN